MLKRTTTTIFYFINILFFNERHTSTSTSTELRASSEGVSESAT